MEGDDSLRTLECLRGRLLAERQASRAAKEEAQLMGNKLIELENKLREETKLREKAENKLKFLKKKLESLKSSTALEGLDQSGSYENCGSSCTSSASTSGPKGFEDMKENSSIRDTSDSNSDPHLKDSPLHKSSYHCPLNSQSYPKLEAGMERNGRTRESDNEDYVDNSLALVPVSASTMAEPTKSSELKIMNRSISEVLDALRHARESIQSSIERRKMIRVGPF
ncbi:hypothetical protein MANES_09G071500v8 [Manihot esculenta]|nr:hypothetical protein MANES_09G071500v8 [Manihot esculenta]